jgi:hypothetical protein
MGAAGSWAAGSTPPSRKPKATPLNGAVFARVRVGFAVEHRAPTVLTHRPKGGPAGDRPREADDKASATRRGPAARGAAPVA